jgi:hypothetical protein
MSKKSTESRKGSARAKVDWKALDVVHPEAVGIDVGGSEHWWRSARIAIQSRCGASDVSRPISARWRTG